MAIQSISAARVAANRANAGRSTGPRTAKGKAASSHNATTHGLLTASTVVAGEDQSAFGALTEKLRAELLPTSGLEELLVDDIVSLVWRVKRIARVELSLFAAGLGTPVARALMAGHEDGALIGSAFAANASSFALLSRYETTLVNRLRRSLSDLERLQISRYVTRQTLLAIPAVKC